MGRTTIPLHTMGQILNLENEYWARQNRIRIQIFFWISNIQYLFNIPSAYHIQNANESCHFYATIVGIFVVSDIVCYLKVFTWVLQWCHHSQWHMEMPLCWLHLATVATWGVLTTLLWCLIVGILPVAHVAVPVVLHGVLMLWHSVFFAFNRCSFTS